MDTARRRAVQRRMATAGPSAMQAPEETEYDMERTLQDYGFKTASQMRKEYFLHGWFIFWAVIRFGCTLIVGYLGLGLFSLMLGFSFVTSGTDPNQMYADSDISSFFFWAFIVVIPAIALIVVIGGALIDLLDP